MHANKAQPRAPVPVIGGSTTFSGGGRRRADGARKSEGSGKGAGPDAAASHDPARAASLAFDEALFAALHAMAIKSPRFQADVQAAMRSGALTASPTQLAASLERLALAGRVSNLIPLGDGGLLITVAV